MRKLPLLFFSALICFFCAGISTNVLAQGNSPYVPKVIPPSPNAASIGKFGDIPVSLYTGASNVDIPIYTIQVKGITVPISLDYHTGGIRLREESGWVGLGWALNAGGVISRTINGEDDFDGAKYFNTTIPDIKGDPIGHPATCAGLTLCGTMGNYTYDYYCNYNVYTNSGTYDFTQAYASGSNSYDLEPDAFTYSFPGGNGKFIISRDRKIILQKQDNIRIEFNTNGAAFTITDDAGNRYFYNDLEYTEPAYSNDAKISSWYLSQIVSQQKDTVTFHYAIDDSWTTAATEISESNSIDCSGTAQTTMSNSTNTYINLTLQRIDFPNGQVQFVFDNNRPDLQGGKKLTAIKLYDKTAQGLGYHKEHQFFYSYFNTQYAAAPAEYLRLKLDSVKELSGNSAIPPYVFTYNEALNNSTLTSKHSYSIDHWGYFNGIYNTTLLPPYEGIFVNHPATGDQYWLQLSGGDRKAHFPDMQVFSLKQVSFPTGGKTLFEYEPNDYDYYNSKNGPREFEPVELFDTSVRVASSSRSVVSGTIDLSNIASTNQIGAVTGNSLSLLLAFRANNMDSLNTYHLQTWQKIYLNFNGTTYDISNSSLNCGGPVCSMTVPIAIPARSVYTWSIYIDPSISVSGFEEVNALFLWKEPKMLHNGGYDNDAPIMAGGLRVKAITDYTSGNTIGKRRKYEYLALGDRNNDGVPDTYTSGRLMSYPSYLRYDPNYITTYSGPVYCRSLIRFGSSNTLLSSGTSGNTVGYDRVTEYTINPQTNATLGKTVYSYCNTSDTAFVYNSYRMPGMPGLGNNLNGYLTNKAEYAGLGSGYIKVHEIKSFYKTVNRIIYYSQKYKFLQTLAVEYANPWGCSTANVPWDVMACIYPSMKSERVLLDSTIEISYATNDTTKFIAITKSNYYDNPLHYQPTRSGFRDSKGDYHQSVTTYPQDYLLATGNTTGSAVFDSMIARNIVSAAVSQKTFINAAQQSEVRTNYEAWQNGSLILPRSVQKSFSSNPLETEIVFDAYDARGNVGQYTTKDGLANCFLWGYNKQYPVAHIIGADLPAVNLLIDQNVLDNPASTDQQVRTELDHLRNGLANTKALVTTYTYKPSVGISSQTDQNGKTTYYEYDELGRLKIIRDQDSNILKKYDYKYAGQ